MFGHQQGLFTPTGSMSNQLGLRTLVPVGQEVVTDAFAHVVRAELGGLAAQGGSPPGPMTPATGGRSGPRGGIARPPTSPYLVGTAAIVVENTHNFGGGRVQSLAALQKLRAFADQTGLAMHLDGARIWNAHVASGVPLATYGALFDTVSVCFSKGAPGASRLDAAGERRPDRDGSRSSANALGPECARSECWPGPPGTRSSTTSPGSPRTTVGRQPWRSPWQRWRLTSLMSA